jgi:hypothetical protein
MFLKDHPKMQDPHKVNTHDNQGQAPVRNKSHPVKKHGGESILNNVHFNTYYICVTTSDT